MFVRVRLRRGVHHGYRRVEGGAEKVLDDMLDFTVLVSARTPAGPRHTALAGWSSPTDPGHRGFCGSLSAAVAKAEESVADCTRNVEAYRQRLAASNGRILGRGWRGRAIRREEVSGNLDWWQRRLAREARRLDGLRQAYAVLGDWTWEGPAARSGGTPSQMAKNPSGLAPSRS